MGSRFWIPKGLVAMCMGQTQTVAELIANSLDSGIGKEKYRTSN